jgi:hypothetical protein
VIKQAAVIKQFAVIAAEDGLLDHDGGGGALT